jgi:hypothetical protein
MVSAKESMTVIAIGTVTHIMFVIVSGTMTVNVNMGGIMAVTVIAIRIAIGIGIVSGMETVTERRIMIVSELETVIETVIEIAIVIMTGTTTGHILMIAARDIKIVAGEREDLLMIVMILLILNPEVSKLGILNLKRSHQVVIGLSQMLIREDLSRGKLIQTLY